MAHGVQSTGFVTKTLAEIKVEVEDDLRSTFGAGINLTPESTLGQYTAIMSERLAELWQLAEAVYSSLFPDSASDTNLDNVASITGTVRDPASLTRVVVRCSGTDGTVLPAGRVVSINGGARFVSLVGATIGTLSAGYVDVEFAAELSGPTPVYAGTLSSIETPVSGWASSTNPADHTTLGADLEGDAALRLRRELELRAQGSAAVESLREAVLAVAGTADCYVFENTTDAVDGAGLPAHSVEVVVDGGGAADIAAAIFANKAAGIATYGGAEETITDSQGIDHAIKYTRPTTLDIYVIANVVRDAALFPLDGATQIKEALVDYAAARYTVGADVVASALGARLFAISGVVDVPSVLIGVVDPPVASTTIAASLRERPLLDTLRITVNLS